MANTEDRTIFDKLAKRKESSLRRILRPHLEEGFDPGLHPGEKRRTLEVDLKVRRTLDDALDQLLQQELRAETVDEIEERTKEQFAPGKSLHRLSKSESFLRYLDAYLYFGVRLLIGRIEALREAEEFSHKAAAVLTGTTADSGCNRTPAGLKRPPVPNVSPEHRKAALDLFLKLEKSPDIQVALDFLDGFVDPNAEVESNKKNEKPDYELWLRGLWHEGPKWSGAGDRFAQITRGITEWVDGRVEFYKNELLEGQFAGMDRAWVARNPLTARFGVPDLYWLSRILRADISSAGQVSYSPRSWLELIAGHEDYVGNEDGALKARTALVILRGVFDFACDLIQNSIELTRAEERALLEPEHCPPTQAEPVRWREALDEELKEIGRQKLSRTFQKSYSRVKGARDVDRNEAKGWSRRIITGEYPAQEIVGLAFSGGGIRSATFGLGVLQGLQDLDLLKSVDYLSTVSGGGFIGSWLLGNVLRTPHWLGRHTNWEASIGHLRRYSKYLAPHTGLLSADTWTMGGVWLRNALLVQLTAFAWLVCILATCTLGKPIFDAVNEQNRWLGLSGESIAHVLSAALVLLIAFGVGRNLWRVDGKKSYSEVKVQFLIVLPSWICGFFTAALLWAQATGTSASKHFVGFTTYSSILLYAWYPWLSLLVIMVIGLAVLGVCTLNKPEAVQPSPLSTVVLYLQTFLWALLSTAVLYFEMCGVMWLFLHWTCGVNEHSWYAFVFGPALVVISSTLATVLFIGFCGRSSGDQTREWWTRLGSWLGIYGAGFMVIGVASVLGPLWILWIFQTQWWGGLKWGAAAGYVGTVISGLYAGKSSKTTGTASSGLEYLARAGAILFIAGGLLGAATILHVFLVEAFTSLSLSDTYWTAMEEVGGVERLIVAAGTFIIGLLLSWRVELNIFGLNYFYRNRLVRCYLGATKWRPGMRGPNRFTGFDDKDDILLTQLKQDGDATCGLPFRGPFPIVNCTLNLGGSADLSLETRKSASFQLTPLRCGSDRCRVGYAPTEKFAGGVVNLGQAISVSGAAVSPNMGYNSSTLVAFMLTMFNVRLGWWFPNPSASSWKDARLPKYGFYYLIRELFGFADETGGFLNVSDGGHFENLGIYELVRRRAKVIVAADGECDEGLQFGSLGNLVRICETDFGARIELDVASIRKQDGALSQAHCAVGRITYSNGSQGWLIYLKASITGDEDVGVTQYRAGHPTFPHESTADQFFTEDQFESYRRLGRHIVRHTFRGTEPGARFTEVAERLHHKWTPAGFSSESFLTHTKTLDAIWERFRSSKDLNALLSELTADGPQPSPTEFKPQELCACLELIQLMENVFIDLRLDDFWEHPDNRGWAMLFSSWAKSAKLQKAWLQARHTFGIRFEYFCDERLGLERQDPVATV